jgi:hypothetical protein
MHSTSIVGTTVRVSKGIMVSCLFIKNNISQACILKIKKKKLHKKIKVKHDSKFKFFLGITKNMKK